MPKEEQQVNEKDTQFASLLAISAKTLAFLCLFLVVLVVSICQCFPFSAMRYFYDSGSYDLAIRYAKSSINRGGDKLEETLLCGVEISQLQFYQAEKDGKNLKNAAQNQEYFTRLLSQNPNFDQICKDKNSYYMARSGSVMVAVGLYSYRDYIYTSHAAASFVLGEGKLLYSGDYPTETSGFITFDEMESLFFDLCTGEYTPDNLGDIAIIFGQLSKSLQYNGEFVYSGDMTTILYDCAARVVAGFDSDYNYLENCLSVEGDLERLYLISAAASLNLDLKNFFESIDEQGELDLMDSYFEVDEMQLYEYYDLMLEDYIANLLS